MRNKIVKGIIFDMDNTLLHSNINFGLMKSEIVSYLLSKQVLPADFKIDGHTASTIITMAKDSYIYNGNLDKNVWKITTKHELEGMGDSKLETGAEKMLELLSQNFVLTVLTNNSYEAAIEALNRNGIKDYFSLIVGREQAIDLKPSSSGINYILKHYLHIPAEYWLSVGDSWIDAAASINADVDFALYQGNLDSLQSRGLEPSIMINKLMDLAEYLKHFDCL